MNILSLREVTNIFGGCDCWCQTGVKKQVGIDFPLGGVEPSQVASGVAPWKKHRVGDVPTENDCKIKCVGLRAQLGQSWNMLECV